MMILLPVLYLGLPFFFVSMYTYHSYTEKRWFHSVPKSLQIPLAIALSIGMFAFLCFGFFVMIPLLIYLFGGGGAIVSIALLHSWLPNAPEWVDGLVIVVGFACGIGIFGLLGSD